MSNYPPGSESDPEATWNIENKEKECEDCEGTGNLYSPEGVETPCPYCKGTGLIELENE